MNTPTDHRQFLISLTKAQRKALTEKSDKAGLIRLTQQWATILLLAVYIALQLPFWQLIMLPLGIILVFQFTLLHETVHYTPFAKRKTNEIIANICGFILLIPAQWFRYFHLEHHRHTHIPGKDPELASPKPQTIKQYIVHISGLPLWWSSLKNILTNATGQCTATYVPDSKHRIIQREAQLMVVGYALLIMLSLLMESVLLLYIWLLPALLGQPFLRIYLLAEHAGCPHENNMLSNTRTTYTTALVRWLAWNMPFHAEHHTFPAVPFFRLPELHVLLREHLQVTDNGYVEFQLKFIRSLS